MIPERCRRCHQFMPRYGQHRCPCDDWQHRRDRSALHRYATALALSLFVGGFGLLYVGTHIPDATLPGVESAVPLDPVVAQHGRAPATMPEVAGSIPVHGANGGTTPSPVASPMTEPSADGYGSGMPVESVPAPDTATVLAGGTTRQGVIAYAEPRFGPSYLATPEPRGTWIVICGVRACTEAVQTNDVGPELRLQRAGRIADVSSVVFEAICGELRFGLCPGSYEVIAGPRVTPPATESEEMP